MLRDAPDAAPCRAALAEIVGESPAMQRLRRQLRALAPLDSTVLLGGETGSGKGQLARALHRLSPRAAQPFVHVDCAALSPTLIESELFGHEKGAFTGAGGRRLGRFETAARGTVFLDEIGDLEARLQSKLLRVLDAREFERLGGSQTLSLRARVVAATRHDLRAAVCAGRFRPDLYFRLAVFQLTLPPLRERREDIPGLVAHGLRHVARRLGAVAPEPSPELLARLLAHSWPGNVRELLNVLERAVAQRPGPRLLAAHLDGLLDEWPAPQESTCAAGVAEPDASGLVERLRRVERREIEAALASSGGNVSGAARRLGIPRSTLRHRMRKHALGSRPRPGA